MRISDLDPGVASTLKCVLHPRLSKMQRRIIFARQLEHNRVSIFKIESY